jgi:hypothetical protein
VTGRVFNPEQQDNRHFLVNGASLANIGGKLGEKFGPYFIVQNGGRVRTIGQWINANNKGADIPAGRAVAVVDETSQFSMAGMFYSESGFVMPLALRQGSKGLSFAEVTAGDPYISWLPLVSTEGGEAGTRRVTPLDVSALPVDELPKVGKNGSAGKPAGTVGTGSIGRLTAGQRTLRYEFDKQISGTWKVQSNHWKFIDDKGQSVAQLLGGSVSTAIPIPPSSQLKLTARMALSGYTPMERKYEQAGPEVLFKDANGVTLSPKYNFLKLNADTEGFVEVSQTFKAPPEAHSIILLIRVPKQESDLRIDWIEIEALP